MEHTESTFKTTKNATIYHQAWLPEGEVRAVIMLVHGLGEHCGRYMNVVNQWVPQGYAVHALDHPGHGKSEGRRRHIDRFDDFITTLHTFSGLLRPQYPDKPFFLLGHSLGGLIASRYLLNYQHEFTGAIISAPAMKVAETISPLTIRVGKWLSVLWPEVGLIPMKADALSRDAQVVRAYLDDPLVSKNKTSARLAAEILKTMHYVAGHAQRITLPILILQGTADRIVDPGGAQILYDTVASDDKTLKHYEGFYHEVFNEPEGQVALEDVTHWLAQRLRA